MEFTYDAYAKLIDAIQESNYMITDYHNYHDVQFPCILRHDIDYSIERAIRFAKKEKELGIKSTYFVLVSSDFYNIFSCDVGEKIQQLIEYGHEVALHFDETVYKRNEAYEEKIIDYILKERDLLEQVCRREVSVVSMHRPSKRILENNLEVPGMVNSYSKGLFQNFKYVSDSHMKWKEDVIAYIKKKQYPKIQILTHAFWYQEKDCGIKELLNSFLKEAEGERYRILEQNFTNLSEIL